ncbi:MAG TPA: RDD family protein [Micromonosporaceae bacterium]
MTDSRLSYAGLVTRVCALIVDALLLAVAVPIVALGPSAIWSALAGSAPGWILVCSQAGAALLPLAYFTVAWWGTGQTAGDLLFGVVVRRASDSHVGLCRAFLRALVGLLLPLIWLIGLGMILVDPRRRALHDRLFGTVVVHKSQQPTLR